MFWLNRYFFLFIVSFFLCSCLKIVLSVLLCFCWVVLKIMMLLFMFLVFDMLCMILCIVFWNIFEVEDILKFSFLYLKKLMWVLNVVIDFDDFCSFNWWYFEVKFILLNILVLLRLVVSFLIVGVWCFLCNMVLFNFFMFM